MDGFDHVDLQQPGLVGRLFGRKPKENALREIQNLLADRSVHDLTAADVENILSEYELPREHAAEGLRDFYRTALTFRVKDFRLSDEEIADLRQLQYVLGLHDTEARAIETDLLRENHRAALRNVPGQLSDCEKTRLDALAARDLKSAVYKKEVQTLMQKDFNKAVADQRLTPEEAERLAAMIENFGFKIRR